MRYAVARVERGANGNWHIQGYIEFDVPKRFNTVRRQLRMPGAFRVASHIEAARSRSAARNYCMDPNDPTAMSAPIQIGRYIPDKRRSRSATLDSALDFILHDGWRARDFMTRRPDIWIRHGPKLKAFLNDLDKYKVTVFDIQEDDEEEE